MEMSHHTGGSHTCHGLLETADDVPVMRGLVVTLAGVSSGRDALQLMCSEVFANVIDHGDAGSVDAFVALDPPELTLRVRQRGQLDELNIEAAVMPGLDEQRGRGLVLIRECLAELGATLNVDRMGRCVTVVVPLQRAGGEGAV